MNEEQQGILNVFWTIQQTKELPRQGMILAGFKRNEVDTVGAHSYTVSVLAYLLAKYFVKKYPSFVNPVSTLEMAIFHDIGEALTGDVGRYVKWKAKKAWDKVEEEAVAELGVAVKLLGDFLQEKVVSYNKRSFPDGWIVKVADSLDAVAQSYTSIWQRKGQGAWLTRNDKNLVKTIIEAANSRTDNDERQFLEELCEFFKEACTSIREEKVERIHL